MVIANLFVFHVNTICLRVSSSTTFYPLKEVSTLMALQGGGGGGNGRKKKALRNKKKRGGGGGGGGNQNKKKCH